MNIFYGSGLTPRGAGLAAALAFLAAPAFLAAEAAPDAPAPIVLEKSAAVHGDGRVTVLPGPSGTIYDGTIHVQSDKIRLDVPGRVIFAVVSGDVRVWCSQVVGECSRVEQMAPATGTVVVYNSNGEILLSKTGLQITGMIDRVVAQIVSEDRSSAVVHVISGFAIVAGTARDVSEVSAPIVLERSAAVHGEGKNEVAVSHPSQDSILYEGTIRVRSEEIRLKAKDLDYSVVVFADVPVRCFGMIGDSCSEVEQSAPVQGTVMVYTSEGIIFYRTGFDAQGTIDGVIARIFSSNEGRAIVQVTSGSAAVKATWRPGATQ